MTAEQHLEAITRHAGPGLVDCVVVNETPLDPETAERYRRRDADVVRWNPAALADAGYEVLAGPLLAQDSQYAWHNPQAVARLILQRWSRRRPEPGRLLDVLMLRDLLRGEQR
jgi:2-phospho-L-lactate transferase/gluconeogenesis factor (CofD/UPF0052 family)